MAIMNFDELNTLSMTDDRKKTGRKKIPIYDYFEDMQISEEEKQKRVHLANLLLEDMLFLFALSKRIQGKKYLIETLERRYIDSVKTITEPDKRMRRHIKRVSENIVDTTQNHSNDNYYTSIDRATSVAENEANAILNSDEYSAAVNSGCTKKKWISYRDERVRADHVDVDGTVIAIEQPFHVGEYMMMYPKDDSLGAGLKEIVNCRCSVEYLHGAIKKPEENENLEPQEESEDDKNGFLDVTAKYLAQAKRGQGTVTELQEYAFDGITYKVDGINVKQRHDDREIEVANLLRSQLGIDIKIVPEINGRYQHVPTPDYLISGQRWDLKELRSGKSQDLLRNIAHKKKKQAENFVFDITKCQLSMEELNRQAEALFNEYYNTKHVNGVIFIEGEKIVRILTKNK